MSQWKQRAEELAFVNGWSWRKIAEEVGIAKSTVSDYLRKKAASRSVEAPIVETVFPTSVEVSIRELIQNHVKSQNQGIYKKDTWKEDNSGALKIAVVADTQCKPTESLEYMKWIGGYINDKRPDVIVHIGDNYDMPSLSSYDKGKKSFEGRRLKEDLEAGTRGLQLLENELQYNPRKVFCLGNHESRIDRVANEMPELDGFIGVDMLPLKAFGWEVVPFLKPIDIGGILFVHYLANPFTGKPYSGTALSQLKTVGKSFVVGHKQCLDIAIRNILDGSSQLGIINGACYPFEEEYKGYQGNAHFRGITMLHEVKDGFGLPMPVSLDYMKEKYLKKNFT